MKQYRSRPLAVDAQQFHGGVADASLILHWINTNGGKGVWCGGTPKYSNADGRVRHPGLPETLRIRTNKGWEQVQVGDYVVRNDQGAFSPCNSETFDRLYENTLADVVDISTKSLDWNNNRIRPYG